VWRRRSASSAGEAHHGLHRDGCFGPVVSGSGVETFVLTLADPTE
jgi:hypothetical protein